MVRLVHSLILFIVFASMWLHGGVAFAQGQMSEMDMSSMGTSCLQHCLDAVHVDEGNDVLIVMGLFIPEFSPTVEGVRAEKIWLPCVESHHDPGQILTIQKRE
ncbi:hypothetical protein EPN81_04720 [Patescibacteria group bacterium]|nr:MAG: hypothetical protein EPN81_04720 [Patescibacteria group bacterium]